MKNNTKSASGVSYIKGVDMNSKSNGSSTGMSPDDIKVGSKEWKEINWHRAERHVNYLQKQIFLASERKDVRAIKKLQQILLTSRRAKLLAVRRVTQDNRGKKTAGIDGIANLKNAQRLGLANNLHLGRKASPVRRVWIPKPGKIEKRSLGIPTMYDRALQALVKLALEPEWEARFEPNSYGFRPGRSCHDAMEAIFTCINQKDKFVYDADISKCFDEINQETVLDKLRTWPGLRKQIKAWLKAGCIDKEVFSETEKGTPQGGVISPLLANIALHGMEDFIQEQYEEILTEDWELDTKEKRRKVKRLYDGYKRMFDEKYYYGRKHYYLPTLVRYADDFVIIHEDLRMVTLLGNKIEQWLKNIGLRINVQKTRIVHTFHKSVGIVNGSELKDIKPGFNFLGFNVRQYDQAQGKVSRTKAAENSHGKKLPFKTFIRPSDESIKEMKAKISEIGRKYRARSQKDLIEKLNPAITGWVNYHKKGNGYSLWYPRMNHHRWWVLWRWAMRRHPKKNKKWIKDRYFGKTARMVGKKGKKYLSMKNWSFQCYGKTKGGKTEKYVLQEFNSPWEQHIKVQGRRSPFDAGVDKDRTAEYWNNRTGKMRAESEVWGKLFALQRGKCAHCGGYFKDDDVIEMDHIIPKSCGGTEDIENLQLLHGHCHDSKTATDGSYGHRRKTKNNLGQRY